MCFEGDEILENLSIDYMKDIEINTTLHHGYPSIEELATEQMVRCDNSIFTGLSNEIPTIGMVLKSFGNGTWANGNYKFWH